ncbi:MAG: CDP-alcohol phosphatidyltransferase family protein [Aquificaceae bacterium]
MRLSLYLNPPNLLSLMRLFLSPFIFFLPNGFIAPFFLLLVLSDALDGLLARSLRRQTELGKVLDPLADKVMILCGLILCVFRHGDLPKSLFYLALSRDLFILLGAILLTIKGKTIPQARPLGKAFTFFFSILIVLCILGISSSRLLWIAFILLFASWVDYALWGIRRLKNQTSFLP